MNKKSNADMISGLPDALIHHIFSFSDMKLVVQTCILSRRWRHLWKSTPTLNFHLDVRKSKRTAFVNFVPQVLFLHDASTIHKFSLSCYQKLDKSLIRSWIIAAIGLNVEEIHIYFTWHSHIKLPDLLFWSQIKIFSLGICQLPRSICSAPRVKCLELLEAILPDGDSNGELTLSCSVLENLILRFCKTSHLKVLTVSTPLLKTLDFKSSLDVHCKINICCPSLKSLKWLGLVDGDYSLQNLSSLVSANISKYIRLGNTDLPTQGLANVISGIYNVKALKLSASLLKTLAHYADLLEGNPILFHNLRYMMLEDWDGGGCSNTLATILERLPHIETFVWERIQNTYELKTKEEDPSYMPLRSIFRYLKIFELRNPQLVEDEFKFIEFLLERAIVLKEVVVKTTNKNALYRIKFAEFGGKLLVLPRSSSSLLISFQGGGPLSPAEG